MTTATTSPSAATPHSTGRHSTALPDALSTPWAGARLRSTATPPVRFSGLAAPTSSAVGTAAALRTPFEQVTVRPPVAYQVDFSQPAAPVRPAAPAPRVAGDAQRPALIVP
jgi:hypothetical protein